MSKGTTTLEFMIGLLIGIAILFALLYPLVSFSSLYFGSSITCIDDQSTCSLDNMISGIERGQASSQLINLAKKECALVFFDINSNPDITPPLDLFQKTAICICEFNNNECTDQRYCKELTNINSISVNGFNGKKFIQLTSGNTFNIFYKKDGDNLIVSDADLSGSVSGQSTNCVNAQLNTYRGMPITVGFKTPSMVNRMQETTPVSVSKAGGPPYFIHYIENENTKKANVKGIALTYDQDCKTLDRGLVNYLIQNKIPATFFITTKFIEQNPNDFDYLKSHSDLFEIGSHSTTHCIGKTCADISLLAPNKCIFWGKTGAKQEMQSEWASVDYLKNKGINVKVCRLPVAQPWTMDAVGTLELLKDISSCTDFIQYDLWKEQQEQKGVKYEEYISNGIKEGRVSFVLGHAIYNQGVIGLKELYEKHKNEWEFLTVSGALDKYAPIQSGQGTTSICQTTSGSKYKELADLISSGEGGYESVNRGRAGDSPGGAIRYLGKNLADMTVKEILQAQADDKVMAVGKYQLIPTTLSGAVQYTKIDLNAKFDAATQDTLFNYLIDVKRPIVGKYINGQSDNRREAIQELAREFASVGLEYSESYKGVPHQRGESLYAGIGGNKASISPDSVGNVLDKLRISPTKSV